MNRKLLHTPEGVRDIYNGECRRKQLLEEKVRSVFDSFGFSPIETPSLEYFDVFSSDVGTVPSADLYKFFDREGDTLVLRPDFTPSVVRAASRYFLEEEDNSPLPVRLWYQGNAFVNRKSFHGQLNEATQMGAELIGVAGAGADAEMIAMVIRALLSCGLQDFQISLGQVQYFEALSRDAGLDAQTEEELKELIRNKNSFGVEILLGGLHIPEELRRCFISLPSLFGGEEILEKALQLAQGSSAVSTIGRLRKVFEILRIYGLERYVSFDLGMMSGYMYYTGIIFRGYTYGVGEPIVKGGRYDNLLSRFGKDAPATGFVILMDQLQSALVRQHIEINADPEGTLILYRPEQEKEAITMANALRGSGGRSVLVMLSSGGYTQEDVQRLMRKTLCRKVISLTAEHEANGGNI